VCLPECRLELRAEIGHAPSALSECDKLRRAADGGQQALNDGDLARPNNAGLCLVMRLRDELARLRRQILATASAHGADQVRLFGSVARGDDSSESDVDFLVTLRPGRTLMDLTRLELALEALIGRSVDVVTEDSLYEPIRRSA